MRRGKYVRIRPAAQYQIKVRTSANSKLGRDSSGHSRKVHARVHIRGSLTNSGPIFLAQSHQEHPFQPGQADIFTVWLADMGEIKSLDIGQSGAAVAGWSIIQVSCLCIRLYTCRCTCLHTYYTHVYPCLHICLDNPTCLHMSVDLAGHSAQDRCRRLLARHGRCRSSGRGR